jgi:hypothetical protein
MPGLPAQCTSHLYLRNPQVFVVQQASYSN